MDHTHYFSIQSEWFKEQGYGPSHTMFHFYTAKRVFTWWMLIDLKVSSAHILVSKLTS